MDRLRQIALAQKARLMDSLAAATPQSLLHSILEGDRNVTRVVIDGEAAPAAQSNVDSAVAGAGNASNNETAASGSSSGAFFSTEMVCAILRAVEESKIVTHLTIANRSDASEFISSLTPAISKNLVLKFLKIDCVDIGDDLSMALFGALSKNTSIETVIVSNIGLTDVAGVSMFLRRAHAVKIFDMSGNTLGDAAFDAFADSLRNVSSSELKEIRFHDTGVTEEALCKICVVLEESSDICPSLRVLDYSNSGTNVPLGSGSTISDATRLRLIQLIDVRISKAAESYKGGKSSDRISDRMSASELMGAVVSNVVSTVASVGAGAVGAKGGKEKAQVGDGSAGLDKKSSTSDSEDVLPGVADEPCNTLNGSVAPEEAKPEAAQTTTTTAASSGKAGAVQQPAVQSSSSSSSSRPAITEAEVAAAVAAANKEYALKTEKLAELLGDSQAQALRLQEELHRRDEKIANLQGGTAAIKEASRAMHQQFQQKVNEAEGAAMEQLKEAAAMITALQDKLKEAHASAVRQQTFFEETLESERAKMAKLEEENRVLRNEYLSELRTAIETQRIAMEEAQHAPVSCCEDVETQTEDESYGAAIGGGGTSSSSSPLRAGMRHASAANLITAAAAAAAAKGASPPPSSAAYEDAVSSFAFVDAEEAEEELATSRWKKDEDVSHCTDCCKEFTTLTRRKHHCRRCGSIFCADCIVKSKVDGKAVCNNCSRSETVIVANNAKK